MACVLGDRQPMAGDSVAVRYSAMVRAYLSGDWAEALACARRIEVRGRAGEAPGASRMVQVLAAEIHLVSGDPARARAWMSSVPDTFVHPLAGQVRVGVRFMSGQSQEAYEGGWRDVRRARESGLLEGTDRLVLRLFEYGTCDDNPRVTQRAVAELEALYEESASPRTGRMLLLARSVLDRDLDAVNEAFHAVRERGDRPLALTCHEWLAMLSEDPAPWLAAAIQEAHALGIRHIERTSFGRRARMYGLKLPLPRRREAKEGFGELDVRLVGMVGEGATNRQIAVRLTCSEKTVEQHLTRLFRLTGCRSRAELAAARLDGTLARLGLPPGASAWQ
jgi:DNA-binding CsgD family transcriptional regulator